jgi:hypothetical protein
MKLFSKVVVAGVIIAATGLLASRKALSMGKKCMFSEVQGVVLHNNQPVMGAVVEREFKWTWKGETGKDQTTTGSKGEFRLPAIYRSSMGSFLPHEPIVRQTILIQHGGQTFKAWMLDKSNYDENGELQGKPIRLLCRLETEPKRSGEVFGICDLQ